MGYVKFTEAVGGISKTYEFGSYEDFKDWEGAQMLVNSKELFVETDGWIENTGLNPCLPADSIVEVRFNDGTTSRKKSSDFYDLDWTLTNDIEDISHYRVVSK